MKPSYIILINSGERLDLNKANEFNPNEYEWHQANDWRDAVGLYVNPNDLNESYCYKADFDERFMDEYDSPSTATTIAFKAYDKNDNLLFQDLEGGCGFWL
jgi:hypothetical protein